MPKATTRTAETTLTVKSPVEFSIPEQGRSHVFAHADDGAGEIGIRVRRGEDGRVHFYVEIIMRDDSSIVDDDGGQAHASGLAVIDPAEFGELLGFERTIQAMIKESTLDSPAVRSKVIARLQAAAAEFGYQPRAGDEDLWDFIVRDELGLTRA